MSNFDRMPCPDRIVDDMGGAFMMGAIGGSIWHGVKGARNNPAGSRMAGAMYAIKARAPILGGQFAVWGMVFSGYDCTFAYLRRKEDPWNAIGAGFFTGGTLAIRAGYKTAFKSAIFGGIILSLIEGVGIMMNKYLVPPEAMEAELDAPMAPMSLAAPPSMSPQSSLPSNFSELPDQEERSTFR